MNRETKFRAWDKKNQKYTRTVWIGAMFGVVATVDRLISKNSCVISMQLMDDYILEQYTGREDKNGKEICVGDKMECRGKIGFVEQAISGLWILSFSSEDNDCVALFGDYDKATNDWWTSKDSEVIGNIHENPEL